MTNHSSLLIPAGPVVKCDIFKNNDGTSRVRTMSPVCQWNLLTNCLFSPSYISAHCNRAWGESVCLGVLVFCLCVSACVCVLVWVWVLCMCAYVVVLVCVCLGVVCELCVGEATFCIFLFHTKTLRKSCSDLSMLLLGKYLVLFDQFVHHACCIGILLSLGSGLWCCHGSVMVHGK